MPFQRVNTPDKTYHNDTSKNSQKRVDNHQNCNCQSVNISFPWSKCPPSIMAYPRQHAAAFITITMHFSKTNLALILLKTSGCLLTCNCSLSWGFMNYCWVQSKLFSSEKMVLITIESRKNTCACTNKDSLYFVFNRIKKNLIWCCASKRCHTPACESYFNMLHEGKSISMHCLFDGYS